MKRESIFLLSGLFVSVCSFLFTRDSYWFGFFIGHLSLWTMIKIDDYMVSKKKGLPKYEIVRK